MLSNALALKIGNVELPNRLFVAPMAGVTDRPFRKLCKSLGAGYAVSEMVTSQAGLRNSLKTSRRLNHVGEPAPIAVQIAGTQPQEMADAARYNVDLGAQVIDINMGCPAKKVCNRWAGSALMQNEALAVEIAQAVVQACAPHGVPVTLKMRTGWDQAHQNAPSLARQFEAVGIQMLTVHGRTREQGYRGMAEYDTIAEVKSRVKIPVVANGDITHARKALKVLQHTQADALMVGRAAQGRPWIFREIAHFLKTGNFLPTPTVTELRAWLLAHLQDHYELYGEHVGVRTARKHIGWYVKNLPAGDVFRDHMNLIDTCEAQYAAVQRYLDELAQTLHHLPEEVSAEYEDMFEAEAIA